MNKNTDTDKLTFTMENYLEAVYDLSNENAGVRLTDVAVRLDVTKSTANSAMSVLAKRKLVEAGHYRRIHLTQEGIERAVKIAEKHKIVRRFFLKALNVNLAVADADACAVEHVISDETVEAMKAFLGE
jgi:Mn-dependent DtxR family transcriptional regulator